MKVKVAKRKIMSEMVCISVPYCSLQSLLSFESPAYYTRGVYGWNADIYAKGNVAIVTGYRPFGNKVAGDVIEKYEKKACELRRNYNAGLRTSLDSLINQFIYEVTGIIL